MCKPSEDNRDVTSSASIPSVPALGQALCWVLAWTGCSLAGLPSHLPPNSPVLPERHAQPSFLPSLPPSYPSSFLAFPVHSVIKSILKCTVLSIKSDDRRVHSHPEMTFILQGRPTCSNLREPHPMGEGPGPPLSP